MAKIILEILLAAEHSRRFITVTDTSVTIGRAMHNDIIIPDPYMNPEHILLDFTTEEWFCQDAGTLNGTFLSCGTSTEFSQKINSRTRLSSGDTLTAGHTSIRVWNSLHPVAPAEPLREKPETTPGKTHNLLPGLLATVPVYYILFLYVFYLDNPKVNVPYMELLSIITLMLAALAFWSGFWALITRFSRHEHRFGRHFLFTCKMAIFSVIAGIILQVSGFYLCHSAADMVINLFTAASAGVFTLYHHMRLATRLPSRKRLLIALLIIIPLIGVVIMIDLSQKKEFHPYPRHNLQTLFLPGALIPTDSLDTTLKRLNSIF